jgi:hypothetical protein
VVYFEGSSASLGMRTLEGKLSKPEIRFGSFAHFMIGWRLCDLLTKGGDIRYNLPVPKMPEIYQLNLF